MQPTEAMPMPMPPASSGGGMHMTMQMTFGARTSGVAFLFDGWKPETAVGFFASCALVLLVAAVLEVTQRFLPRLERWLVATQPSAAARNAGRAAYTVLTSGVSYALMLLSMTFNVYIFASIILGFGLGALLGGQLHERDPMRHKRLAELDVSPAPPAEQVTILRVDGLACSACVVAVESVGLASRPAPRQRTIRARTLFLRPSSPPPPLHHSTRHPLPPPHPRA